MSTVNDATSSHVEPSSSSENNSENIKSFFRNIMGEVSKGSAMKQICIGAGSGWITGIVTVKIGKMTAYVLGSGVLLLQIAAHQGYIDINWDKIKRKAEKVSDKIDEKITGQGPHLLNKVERFVDRKLDKAEQILKKGGARTRRWYHALIGEDDFQLKEIHIFLISFAAGVAIGIGTAN